jgi:hypothetical protein
VVLSRAFESFGGVPAWGRKQVRDLRTLFALAPETTGAAYRIAGADLVDHIAVNDCIKQIRVLRAVMRSLGR